MWQKGNMFKRARPISCCLLLFCAAACHEKPSGHYQGYIEGEYVYVSAPVSGRLQTLDVERGSRVENGRRLFSLEATPLKAARDEATGKVTEARSRLEDLRKGSRPTEIAALQARLSEARAAYEYAKKEFERLDYLYHSKASAQAELDRARSQFEQTKSQVAALESELATAQLGARSDQVSAQEANVKSLQGMLDRAQWELAESIQNAPVAGLISDTLYRVGEWVAAGRPVVVLLPPENIKARTFVPEAFLSSLQPGSKATISVDGRAETLEAVVSFIAPKAEYTPPVIYSRENREKLVYLIELKLLSRSAGGLNPGQPIEVDFGG